MRYRLIARYIMAAMSVVRPFPSCCEPHHESEAKCKTFHMKISFVCILMKTNFHNKNFALSLAFIIRFKATRKWSVNFHLNANYVSKFSLVLAPTWRQCNQPIQSHKVLLLTIIIIFENFQGFFLLAVSIDFSLCVYSPQARRTSPSLLQERGK